MVVSQFMKKIPLQVYVDQALHQQLCLTAKRKKVSQSELVRKYLYQGLQNEPGLQDPALDIIGLGAGKTPDLSERHDHYLVFREKENYRCICF